MQKNQPFCINKYMPNITLTQSTSMNAVPLQNITLSVTPSANFAPATYLYQWKADSSNIAGAVAPTYKFDAPSSSTTYTCVVSGLSSGALQDTQTTANIVLTIAADASIFSRHLPKGANPLNETGQERFLRIRNLGYC